MWALTPAIRTELAQFHAIRIILLVFRRNIVPALALCAGKRHQNAILFAFGRHAFPALQAFTLVAAPALRPSGMPRSFRYSLVCNHACNHAQTFWRIPLQAIVYHSLKDCLAFRLIPVPARISATQEWNTLLTDWFDQERCHTTRQPGQETTLVTAPAPTVRPPSRMAKRLPSSSATGAKSSTFIVTLSPGITISTPSGNPIAPVTSVVRM